MLVKNVYCENKKKKYNLKKKFFLLEFARNITRIFVALQNVFLNDVKIKDGATNLRYSYTS